VADGAARDGRRIMKSRIHTWLMVIVLAGGLLMMGIAGLFVYVSNTAETLHPTVLDIPSVATTEPTRAWTDAVQEARQVVRTGLAEQNLPGLSVAVGIGNDLVWAEGFGWADLESRTPVAPDTRFRIGTASTALTSAAVGLLLEQDRLTLDETIHTYVPDFPTQQWPATLRRHSAAANELTCLRHRTGPAQSPST
jgi:CubicO group peptidase (beta-lactamase class C family)